MRLHDMEPIAFRFPVFRIPAENNFSLRSTLLGIVLEPRVGVDDLLNPYHTTYYAAHGSVDLVSYAPRTVKRTFCSTLQNFSQNVTVSDCDIWRSVQLWLSAESAISFKICGERLEWGLMPTRNQYSVKSSVKEQVLARVKTKTLVSGSRQGHVVIGMDA